MGFGLGLGLGFGLGAGVVRGRRGWACGSEWPRAYFMATSRSRVVERKANSTPPMTLCAFLVVRIVGRPKPETPR